MSFDTEELQLAPSLVSGSYLADGKSCDDIGRLEQRPDTDGVPTNYYPSRFKGFGSSFDKEFFLWTHVRLTYAQQTEWHQKIGSMPQDVHVIRLDDNDELVVVRDEHANMYLVGEGHSVLNAAALCITTPDAQEIDRYRRCCHPLLLRLASPVPTPAVWLGDRVVVMDGEHSGKSGLITEIRMFDSATQTTYYAEIRRLDWDHTSSERPIYAPISALARHAFDILQQFRLFDRVRVVTDPLYGGAVGRVVEVCGVHITVSIDAALPLAGPTAPCNVLLGQRSFVVRVNSSRREWKLGDVFWVRGENILERERPLSKGERRMLLILCRLRIPVLRQQIEFPLIFDPSGLKYQKRGARFEGIEVQIIKGVHKGFRGTIIGDYDSESRAQRMDWQEELDPSDFAGILLSIRAAGSNHVISGIRVEDVYHAASMRNMNDAIKLPPEVFFGSQAPAKPPPVVGLFRTIPERRNVTPPPDIDNGPLWPSSDCSDVTLTGEFTGMWMCSPAFAGKKIDVRIHGLHQLKVKVANRILGLEVARLVAVGIRGRSGCAEALC
ncbi:hypothetical protein B0H14DRAFT_2635323, partial [Mycena olivaceomarginata]